MLKGRLGPASRRSRSAAIRDASLILAAAFMLLCVANVGRAVDSDPGGEGPGLVNGNPNIPETDETARVEAGYGTYSTSVKIETPRYRGTAPDIELMYSSSARNGFVAKGWRLTAESYIDRVSPGGGKPRYDGGAFCGAGSDTFSLDGLELVNSMSMGGDYSGRRQTYQRIDKNSCTFVVYEKNGLKKTYLAHINAAGTTFRWALRYIDDTHGTLNRVSYFYTGSSSSPERYLDRIEYGPYRIKFFREARTDALYLSTGASIGKLDERLSYIRVEENIGGSYSLIRRYDLSHSYSTMSGVSMLDYVRFYGSNDSSSLPETVFTYNDDAYQGGRFTIARPPYTNHAELPVDASLDGTDWLTGDFDGDGHLDLFQFPARFNNNDNYRLWLNGTASGGAYSFSDHFRTGLVTMNTGTWIAGDFDGDGRTDVLQAGLNANTSRVWISQGTSFDLSGVLLRSEALDGNFYPVMNKGRWQTGDFNGDGMADLYHAGDVNGRSDVWLATGDGHFDHHQTLSFDIGYAADKALTFAIDVNGDGLTDVVQIPKNLDLVLVFISDESGTLGSPVTINKPSSVPQIGSGNHAYGGSLSLGSWAAGDFNGDGLVDLAHGGENDYLFTWFSRGNGTFDVYAELASGSYTPLLTTGYLLSGDQDGDGKTDLVHIADANIAYVWYSRGDGDYTRVARQETGYGTIPLWNVNFAGHWHSGDFDGDGVDDLFNAPYNSSESSQRIRIWTGTRGDYGDLVSKVEGVYGAEDHIAYRTTTDLARTYLPPGMVLPLVDTLERRDGRAAGNETTWTYTYGNADWSNQERCFLGFASVSVSDSSDGMVTTTTYIQNDSCLVQSNLITKTSGASTLYRTDYDYIGNQSAAPYSSLVSQVQEQVFQGSQNQTTITTYQYTPFGERSVIVEYGLSVAGLLDERLTRRFFAGAGSSYVVDRPYQVNVYHAASENSQYLDEAKAFYFDFAAKGAPITTGDVTRIEDYNSDVGTWDRSTYRWYDSFGNLIRFQTPGNVVQSIGYDAQNLFPIEECRIWVSASNKSFCTGKTWNYKFQKVETSTDLNSEVTTNVYDVLGRVGYITSPDPSVSSGIVVTDYEYVNLGNPDTQYFEITRPDSGDGLTERTYFDGLSRVWKETWEGVYQRDTDYVDTGGRVDRQTSWYDNVTETPKWTIYSYDTHRRLDGIQHPSFPTKGIATADIEYGITGGWLWERRYRAAYPNEIVQPKTIWRDGLGRIAKIDTKNDGVTYSALYGYDARDRLLSVNQFGESWTFVRNSLGEIRSSTDPDRGTRTYTYYLDGLPNTETDAKGQTTIWVYDALRRVTSRTDHDGAVTAWEYDGLPSGDPDFGVFSFNKSIGKLVRTSYVGGRDLHNWHRSGLEAATWRCVGTSCNTTRLAYDRAGRMASVTYPDLEVVNYAYDTLGNLNSVSGVVTNMDWSARSRESDRQYTRIEFANGALAVYGRSSERGWLNSATVTVNGGPALYQAGYGWSCPDSVDTFVRPGRQGSPASRLL